MSDGFSGGGSFLVEGSAGAESGTGTETAFTEGVDVEDILLSGAPSSIGRRADMAIWLSAGVECH